MPNRSASEVADQVVVARHAIVIGVGDISREYARVVVKDRTTGEDVEIADTDGPPLVEEQIGTTYAFREGQRVRADHPAVLANPGAFRPIDATDEIIFGLPPTAAADPKG